MLADLITIGLGTIIAIGAVIRCETPHFDYVCDTVNRGVLELNLSYNKPVAFGVLTTDNVEQALDRAGIDKGNKGSEAALALCDMIALGNALKNHKL
jgi:6,7-dimethyl-8-ribityllumazine synthase